ncbi:MAG: putative Ig domain-containing protein, partial [Pseudomonadota bacterium]
VATLALDVPTAALGDIVVTITSDEAIGTFDLAGVTLTDGDGTPYAANTSDFTAGATAIAVTFAAPVGGFPQGTAYSASLAADAIADAGGNGAEAVTLDTPVPFEIDDAPVFTNAPGAIVVAENIDGRIATYAATDADGDTVTYALDDAGETAGFSIDAVTGELSIDTAFDFEVDPNSYIFGVTATSTGTDGAASIVKPVTVTITDVDEAPDAPRNETVTVEEDTDVVILANDGDDNGGADTVQGTADELDGVTIENFEEGDAVQVEANDATANVMIVDVRQGSVILGLDTTGDGQEDTTVTLEGSDFEDDDQETANDFQVEVQDDGSTKIIYAPVQPNLPVRIQAEDFDDVGTSNFFEQTASAADEGALIRLGANQTGSVSLDLAAAGVQAGLNTLIIQVFDENDGASTLTASIGDIELGPVTLDEDGGGNAAQAANKRLITFTDVDVPDGATLTLSGTSDNSEFLRIDFVEFTATAIVENGAPEIVPSFAPEGAITIAAGDALDLLTAFADPEEDPLAFTVADGDGNSVPGVSIVDGTLAVAADAGEGMVGIVLSATDPSGSGQTVSLQLTLTIDPPVAVPPVAGDPIDPQTATEDTLFSVEVPDELFTDANGDDIVVTAALAPAVVGEDPAPLPAWLTFTPATDTSPATLSGTPTQADIDALGDAPQLTILLTGTDDDGAATSTFMLDLTEVNDAPVVNPEADPIDPIALAAGGTPIRIPLDDRFIDEEGNPFALSITGATNGGMVEILPEWVTLETTDQGDGSTITELVIAPPADAVTDATTFAVEVVATETDTSDLLASEPVSINVTVSPPAGQALFLANVDADDLLGASTFTGNSMQIQNKSANGVEITKVTIDLASTFIPQTVFDTGSPSAGDAANK